MKTIILFWDFYKFYFYKIQKNINSFFFNLTVKTQFFITAKFVFSTSLVILSITFQKVVFSTNPNHNNSGDNLFGFSFLNAISKSTTSDIDPIETEINNLFLSKSVSLEQINKIIDTDFPLDKNKQAKEKVITDHTNGIYFVLSADYPSLVKSFESLLIKASKENNPINYRSKLQQVKHLEIYLDGIK